METKPDLVPAPKQRRWLSLLWQQWKPVEVSKPAVDPELHTLTDVQRSAEVFRYSVLTTEYWLSPKGKLREWLRLNLLVSVVVGIPGLLIVPIITYLLGQFVTWTELLMQIGRNLLVFPVTVIAAIAVFTALLSLIRVLLHR